MIEDIGSGEFDAELRGARVLGEHQILINPHMPDVCARAHDNATSCVPKTPDRGRRERVHVKPVVHCWVGELRVTHHMLGTEAVICARMAVLHVHASSVRIIGPAAAPERARYAEGLYRLRQRKGMTQREAEETALNRTTFGALMVRAGEADPLIGGLTQHYPDTIRPALQMIAVRPDLRKVSRVYMLITPWPRLPFAPPKRCGASGKNRV
jgi:hypothetical protein